MNGGFKAMKYFYIAKAHFPLMLAMYSKYIPQRLKYYHTCGVIVYVILSMLIF